MSENRNFTELIEQLKIDEGLRLKAYYDSVGKYTIGYGRNLDDKGITENEARLLLLHDVVDADTAITNHIPWTNTLDDVRYSVLVNMAFNMGIGGLVGFPKMLAAVQAGNWSTAAHEMISSKWAHQVGERATRLALQMLSGKFC